MTCAPRPGVTLAAFLLAALPAVAQVAYPVAGHAPSLLPEDVNLRLAWADEFDGERLDGERWMDFVPSFLGRTSGFLFARDNVAVTNGCLNLTARNLRDDERTVENLSRGYDKYATAIVRTRDKRRYGYYEARARGMRASVCNAFWLFDPLSDRPAAKHRPGGFSDEIDIFEFFGKPANTNMTRVYSTTVHRLCTPYVEATVGYRQTLLPRKTSQTKVDFDFWADYHVYGFLWTPETMRWYVDGREVFSRTNDQFHAALHVTLDCEVMPDWGGNPPPEDLPQTFSIDHVRVFDLVGPAPAPAPECRPPTAHVTPATLDRFCWNNLRDLVQPVRGIVVEHHALGEAVTGAPPDGWQADWAAQGVVWLRPRTNPWCWMNDAAVRLTDRLVQVVRETTHAPNGVRIVSLGNGGLGGLGALIWPCHSRQRIAAVLAGLPICDLPLHARLRPEAVHTLADAYADAADLDFALRQHSPTELIECLPKVPVFLALPPPDATNAADTATHRYAAALRAAGRTVQATTCDDPAAPPDWTSTLRALFPERPAK